MGISTRFTATFRSESVTSNPIWPPWAAQTNVFDVSSNSMNFTPPVAENTGRMNTNDITIAAIAIIDMNRVLLFTADPLNLRVIYICVI